MSRSCWVVALLCLALAAPTFAGEAGRSEDGNFFIREGDFTLNTELRLQIKASYEEEEFDLSGPLYSDFVDTSEDPTTDFSVRRGRIAFFGQAFAPWLRYKIEADFGDGKSRLTDAYVEMKFANASNWRFGQFKQPFDFFQLMSSKYFQFVERPVGTDLLSPARDIGVMYYGSTASKRYNWSVALQNGNGPNHAGNDNDEFRLAARFEMQNEGGFKYMETAANHPEKLEWTVGLAYQSNPQGELVGNRAVDEDDEPPFDCEIGISQTCDFENRDQTAYELFGAVRGRNWQFNGTYQMWSFEDDAFKPFGNGDLADRDLTYFNVQFGFFVAPKWEIAARYATWENDDPLDVTPADLADFPGELVSDVKSEEWRLGTNYYFSKHNFKLMVDYGEEKETFDDEFFGQRGKTEDTISGLRAMLAFFI
ncbi:MAG: hypothetical protein KBD01_19265 [Acidobacteria bacterium]|nr:hypothetical protein [Acidobacteriota bacterium]